MTANLFLTDEASDISGYLRAKIDSRSDNCSHVRAVTSTEAGPSSGVQVTRSAGGTALAWITDRLDGADLTAAAWVAHIWAKESNAAANASLRVQVYQYTNTEAGTALLDSNPGTELTTTVTDIARTTDAATLTTLADGDRLVIKLLIDDAGTMATGYTVTASFNGQRPGAEGDSYLTCPDNLAVTAVVPTATREAIRRHLLDTDSGSPLLSDAEVDQALDAALRTYSSDRPWLIVEALSGDGSTYDFSLPRLWVHGFSAIQEIEYPAGSQNRDLLEDGDWEILEGVLGIQPTRKLRFASTPESGTDNIVVTYTTRHVHTDELDSVPPDDFTALTWLAASYAARTLSAHMAASSDPTVGADAVNHRDGQIRWASVAKEFERLYKDHLGVGRDVQSGPVSRFADWDLGASDCGDLIFHRRRLR